MDKKKKWSEAQKRYTKSPKGLEARRRYQQSEKGKASHATYLTRRKAKLAEAKKGKEITQVETESETGKIKEETVKK